MRTIWKWPLPTVQRETVVKMPQGAHLLTVQMQDGTPTLWAVVDPEGLVTERRFLMYGTGWQMSERPMLHLGTVQDGAGFVWHYFEAM